MQEAVVPLIEAARSLDPSSLAPVALDAVLGPALRLALWAVAAAIALVLVELAVRAPAANAATADAARAQGAIGRGAGAVAPAARRMRSGRAAAGDLPPAA